MSLKNDRSRREFVVSSLLAPAVWLGAKNLSAANTGGDLRPRLPVAGVTTVYQKNSHADVILGKILQGYNQKGGPGPNLQLVSMYVEQKPSGDLSRELSQKYNVPLFDSIERAITVGGDKIPVAGVLSIGEHGNYPYTRDTRQHQYPRRRFFDAIAATFEKYGKVVPVFNDKHLAYAWKDARHIIDVTGRLKIPFMAGSSIPTAWRKPGLELPRGCEIEEAIALGYGGAESYGFHTLAGLQCMVERRKGGETGVKSVQALTGEEIWQAEKQGRWSRSLLEAGLATLTGVKQGRLEKLLSRDAPFYFIEYRDGLKATVAMLNGVSHQFGFAARLKGKDQPAACQFVLQDAVPYGHFAWLLKAIEHMIHTGRPAYPAERTLLTTGVLDRAMHSLAKGGVRLASPELSIRYQAVDWPFAHTSVGQPPT